MLPGWKEGKLDGCSQCGRPFEFKPCGFCRGAVELSAAHVEEHFDPGCGYVLGERLEWGEKEYSYDYSHQSCWLLEQQKREKQRRDHKRQQSAADWRLMAPAIVLVLVVVGAVVAVIVGLNSGGSRRDSRHPASQGQTVGTMREVKANQLNMRSGPGQNYSVVKVFTRNERIVTVGESQTNGGQEWIYASTPDGQTRGWVTRKFLAP